ncbi:hypothetical protein [Spirosoma litoris]
MPVAQFSNARNWGYDGVFWYTIQDSYGGASGTMKSPVLTYPIPFQHTCINKR